MVDYIYTQIAKGQRQPNKDKTGKLMVCCFTTLLMVLKGVPMPCIAASSHVHTLADALAASLAVGEESGKLQPGHALLHHWLCWVELRECL